MTGLDLAQPDCPSDVVDHLLWRNAQAILRRHVVAPDGTCQWCGHGAPCSPRRLAERAAVVSRQAPDPALAGRTARAGRADATRLLPLLIADSPPIRGGWTRNSRH